MKLHAMRMRVFSSKIENCLIDGLKQTAQHALCLDISHGFAVLGNVYFKGCGFKLFRLQE